MSLRNSLMKKNIWTIVLLLLSSTTVYAESMTLTTYYPAPYGAYDRLRLVPRADLPSACEIGMLFVRSSDGTLRYCANDGTGNGLWGPLGELWVQDGNDFYPLNDSNPNLKVGIGILTPGDKLDVTGDISVADGSGYRINEEMILRTPSSHTYLGINTGASNTSTDQTFIGHEAGFSNTSGRSNTYVGYHSGYWKTTGFENAFLGYSSGGGSGSSAYNDTFIGYNAGNLNTSGFQDVYVGYNAAARAQSSPQAVFVGSGAGAMITGTPNENVFVGALAGTLTGGGEGNIIVGSQVAYNGNGFQFNVMMGHNAAYNIANGDHNVYIGESAGYNSGSALYNTYVGKDAGYNATGGSNVFIGYQAGYNEVGSGKLYINNSNGTPLIYGDFAVAARQVGIDTNNLLGEKLTVPGGVYIHSVNTGLEIDSDDLGTFETKLIARPNAGTNQSALAFYTAPGSAAQDQTERVRIDKDGNVGIGTSTPNARLHVNGVVRIVPTDGPGSCDANMHGGIYYDSSMSETCQCNGASWIQVDGGGICN